MPALTLDGRGGYGSLLGGEGRSERNLRDGRLEKAVCHWFMEETDARFKEKARQGFLI